MNNNIIIIGNGFDLAHNLKTTYRHFVDFYIDKYLKDPNETKDLIPITLNKTITNRTHFFNYLNSISLKGNNSTNHIFIKFIQDISLKNWSDIEELYFEMLLGTFNTKYDCYYEEITELNKDFSYVKKRLNEYLLTQQKSIDAGIDAYSYFFKTFSRYNTCILNFNYTDIVKKYINVPNMKYLPIHGELKNELNPIIFGYAANEDEIKTLLDLNNNEYLINIKRHNYKRTIFFDDLNNFLNSNMAINIFILGHSCGISDKLILNQIFNHKNIKSIKVFYYDTYENYFNTVANIDRIIENPNNFNKIVNFENSYRMYQYNDNEQKTAEFINYINSL